MLCWGTSTGRLLHFCHPLETVSEDLSRCRRPLTKDADTQYEQWVDSHPIDMAGWDHVDTCTPALLIWNQFFFSLTASEAALVDGICCGNPVGWCICWKCADFVLWLVAVIWLLDFRWNSRVVLHVMSMMRDIALTNEELSHVIAKCLRQLTELEQNELPPLIYQLLLLSAKVGICWILCTELWKSVDVYWTFDYLLFRNNHSLCNDCTDMW